MMTVTTSPSVSVLMPVYNGERYLASAVESILNQTHRDFEFVIIDDGSTDRSPAILDEYARRDARVHVHRQPNGGIVSALNAGLERAIAPWVARMDADDISEPRRLEVQLREVAKRPRCVALGSQVLLIDPDGRPIGPFSCLTTHSAIDAAHLAGQGGAISHPAVLVHRETVRRLGGYRSEMATAEDLDLFLRLAEVGEIGNLPDCLLRYRLHANSIGHARRAEQLRRTRLAVAEARARRRLPDAPVVEERTGGPETTHHQWSWRAIQAGNVATARYYAWQAIKAVPFAATSWRLLYCALRGH